MSIITKVWKKAPGKFFFLATKDRMGKWEDHSFSRSEFDEIDEFIEDNMDKDVYWCPHGFSKSRRLKEFAEIPKMLWADLDEVNPRDLDDLMPSIAWESSPGRFACIWNIDTYMTEELNRRLTHHIGADKGGWDLTQVLRVPGTKNYKYVTTPTVKLLWSDGDSFKTDFLEKKLPQEKFDKASSVGVKEIYKKYEKKFNTFIRKELLNGKPTPGKRSEVIWKLANEIIEVGATVDEAFELLRASPWNKFKDRRDGDAQLRRELDKALSKHLQVSINGKGTFKEEDDEEDEDDEEYVFLGKSMADVEEEEIDWVWYPYVARNELTILEGDPGLGKSYMAQMLAKHIVDGQPLPCPPNCKKLKPIKGRIAYFDIENHPNSVTKKRLRWNGCINLKDYVQEDHPFSIDDEETLLKVHEAIEKLRPTIVFFDTLNTYIGSADIHKSSESQQAMANFLEIARRYNCAVVVLRHLTKSTKGVSAIYRGQGSIAFTGLARVVITVGRVPEDLSDDKHLRALAVTKINVTEAPPCLTFAIRRTPELRDNDKSIFEWGDYIDLNADEMVSMEPKTKRDKEKVEKDEDIIKFIEEFLEGGPMAATAVCTAAEARGISRARLYKIAEEMGVINPDLRAKPGHKKRAGGWSLPVTKKKHRFKNDDEEDAA